MASKNYIFPEGLTGSAVETEGITKCGWIIHCIPSGDNTPFGSNSHTHGFPENYNHPDIQICIPTTYEIIHSVFWIIFNEYIKKGIPLTPGEKYDKIIKGYKMRAVAAVECGREVIRMCCPDKNGKYIGEFEKQLTMVSNNIIDNEE